MQEIVSLGRNNPALKFGAALLMSLLCAIVFGQMIDRYVQTTPWVTLLFVLYAIVGNFMILMRKNNAPK